MVPTISVPDPLATYIVYGVFMCLVFGQLWFVRRFVPARYGRPIRDWSLLRRLGRRAEPRLETAGEHLLLSPAQTPPVPAHHPA